MSGGRFRLKFAIVALSGLLAGLQTAEAQTTEFAAWLEGVKREALAEGISSRTVQAALAGVEPIPRILELDRRQPEKTISFNEYVKRTINQARIDRGRHLLREHGSDLDRIGRKYGIQPRFIVALWGIETDFGRNMGGFKVVDALATLAHDGRRSSYFRKELLAALRILDQGHIARDAMRGSWAGAMGQSQFMPTTFLKYAQDYDGDGRRDIWSTRLDVFASAANYLTSVGWDPTKTWGREVRLPKQVDAAKLIGLETRKPLAEWARLGVRQTDGGALPTADLDASLVMPDGPDGRAFLVYDNYRTIMHWNRSTYFATTVGLLADLIGGVK